MGWDAQFLVIGEVALAILLGGLIGIEREIANKAAGFRTHMLVAGAAALFVGLGDALLQSFRANPNVGLIRSDPIHIVEAIIAGISFLGAGTIFRRDGGGIEGLTTAASILLCAGIGISVALRQIVLAVGVTLLALIVLRGLILVERWMATRAKSADQNSLLGVLYESPGRSQPDRRYRRPGSPQRSGTHQRRPYRSRGTGRRSSPAA